MTEQEYVDKINHCDFEVENGQAEGFSYLHYLKCPVVDSLNKVEQGLLKVLEHVEEENGEDLTEEKMDLKRVLDAYYETLKDAEKKYQHKVDHILWERILPRFKKRTTG